MGVLVKAEKVIRFIWCGLISGLFALAAHSVAADEGDTLNFSVGSALQFNSNVFRTPDTSGPQPGFSKKGDYSNVSHAGLNIDKAYSQQRFQLGGTYSITRYDTFSTINSDTLSYQGAWLWALTPHLTGSLNASQSQAQVSFADLTGATQRNIRTTTNQNLSIDAWVSGKWHLIAAVGKSEASTEQALLAAPGTRGQSLEGGVRYVATSNNTITFTHRVKPTDLVNFALDTTRNLIETNYRDIESELKVDWRLSGKSSINGRLARKSRRNEHIPQRDFSGIAGDISYAWKASDKLQFTFGASRDISPFSAFGNASQSSNDKLDHKLSLTSSWQTSAKTSVNLSLSRTLSDYRGDVLSTGSTARTDDLRSAQLGLNWEMKRFFSLSASLGRDLRTSNAAGFQFGNNAASVGAELKF